MGQMNYHTRLIDFLKQTKNEMPPKPIQKIKTDKATMKALKPFDELYTVDHKKSLCLCIQTIRYWIMNSTPHTR